MSNIKDQYNEQYSRMNNISLDDEMMINELLNEDIDENYNTTNTTNITNITNTTNTANINTQNDSINQLYQASYEMALNTIPEMLIPINMIILNGEINDIPIKILLDTGASSSIIFNSAIEKLKLADLIDTEEKVELQGIGNETSLGRLWYVELKLDSNIYPISLIVSNSNINNFDMILGINFLQSYKALIDFKHRCLTLNDQYKINFNL
jgi:hypothetical protein